MNVATKLVPAFLLAAFGVSVSSIASADEIYSWPHADVLAVVENSSGVLLVGKDKTVWRAYSWKHDTSKHGTPLFLGDIDGDGQPEIVGGGKPTFVLDTSSDPIWFHKKGCEQLIVADFVADGKLDLACRNGKEIKVYTFDGQFVWGTSIGKRYDWCMAGDINGDLKAELECKIKGSKKFSRFDGATGNPLAEKADPELTESGAPAAMDGAGAKSLDGKTEHDLNADGTAEESVIADGDAIVVKSRSKKVAVARVELGGKPLGVVVQDLDADKKLDIVTATKKSVFVVSADGKTVQKFSANAKKYKRSPVAELKSVYASGFAADDVAQKAVHALKEKLAKCYRSTAKKNLFAGTGQMLLSVAVDKKGKVTSVNKQHSDLTDSSIVKCAQKELKKGKFGKAAGDAASINVMLHFTYRDS